MLDLATFALLSKVEKEQPGYSLKCAWVLAKHPSYLRQVTILEMGFVRVGLASSCLQVTACSSPLQDENICSAAVERNQGREGREGYLQWCFVWSRDGLGAPLLLLLLIHTGRRRLSCTETSNAEGRSSSSEKE